MKKIVYYSCLAPPRTREEILTHVLPNGLTYYEDWCNKVRAVGREHLISEESAVEDYCAVYWCSEKEIE